MKYLLALVDSSVERLRRTSLTRGLILSNAMVLLRPRRESDSLGHGGEWRYLQGKGQSV